MTFLPNIFSVKQNLKPEAGKLLVAEPLLSDGIFGRSVVLLVEHNEDGSIGYVLNKHTGFTIQQLLPVFKGFYTPVFFGGPVATNTLHFVYHSNEPVTNSKKVEQDLYWGGDVNEFANAMKKGTIKDKDVFFFIGYAGWGKKQLEQEIKKNYWVVSQLNIPFLFNEDPEMLWKRSVILLDKKYHFWLNVPKNPSFN